MTLDDDLDGRWGNSIGLLLVKGGITGLHFCVLLTSIRNMRTNFKCNGKKIYAQEELRILFNLELGGAIPFPYDKLLNLW